MWSTSKVCVSCAPQCLHVHPCCEATYFFLVSLTARLVGRPAVEGGKEEEEEAEEAVEEEEGKEGEERPRSDVTGASVCIPSRVQGICVLLIMPSMEMTDLPACAGLWRMDT